MGAFEPGRHGAQARVHAWPVGLKCAGLFVASGLSTVLWRLLPGMEAAWGEGTLLLACLALCSWAGFGVRRILSWAVPALWLVGALSAVRLLGEPWSPELGLETLAQAFALLSVILLARLLVATTRTSALVEAITRWLRPLRPLGAKPQTFALAVALVIRSLPLLSGAVDAVLSAHSARGLKKSVRSVCLPVAMTAVSSTIATSEALAARMLPAEEPNREKDSGGTAHGQRKR